MIFIYTNIYMAYLYRHIRLDKNEPFYIGIGSDEKYSRAYDKYKRSCFWKSIAKKTEFEVDIMLDDLSWEEACEKEKEFIKLYGRKNLNEGSLVNMTDGGEGVLGAKRSEKNIKDFVERTIVSVLQYDLQGNFLKKWKSASEASRELNIQQTQIIACCKGHHGKKSAKGFVWRYADDSKWFDTIYVNNKGSHNFDQKHQKAVLQYSKEGVLLNEWFSIREAERQTGVFRSAITNCCKNTPMYNTAGGFIWKYKNKI